MPQFLRWIAVGLAVTFVGSVIALAACAYPAVRPPRELSGLQKIVVTTARQVRPVVIGIINLVK